MLSVPQGEPTLTDAEIAAVRAQIPDWEVIELDGIKRLRRVFTFRDFAQALGLTDTVGRLAEEERQHPALLTEWGRTTVTWWTHKIGGLAATSPRATPAGCCWLGLA